jgi:hypothetical protein
VQNKANFDQPNHENKTNPNLEAAAMKKRNEAKPKLGGLQLGALPTLAWAGLACGCFLRNKAKMKVVTMKNETNPKSYFSIENRTSKIVNTQNKPKPEHPNYEKTKRTQNPPFVWHSRPRLWSFIPARRAILTFSFSPLPFYFCIYLWFQPALDISGFVP